MNKETKQILLYSGLTILVGGLIYFGYKFTVKAFKMGKKAVQMAERYLNEKEKSGNQGFYNPELEQKVRKAGWVIGQPYCAYFVKAMWLDAYPEQANKLKRILTGGTQYTWQLASQDKTGTVSVSKEAQVGDIVIWQSYKGGKAKSSGHAGIVKEVKPDGLITIEGNTGATGGRDGDGIYEKNRSYAWNVNNGLRLKGFIHLNKNNNSLVKV